MSDGMLVSRKWLEKVDSQLTKTDAAPAPDYGTASRFYDIRPARLQTAWTQNAAGLWTATARFIVNDAVDNSFTFPVCAPTATSSPGGTAESTRFFVVWRGRWELLAGAASPTVTKKNVVSAVSATKASAVTSAVISNTKEQIEYIASISVDSGQLVFTTAQKNVVTDSSVVTQTGSFVADFGKSTEQVVGSVSWQ